MKIISILLFLASTGTALAADIAFGRNQKVTLEFKAKVIAIAADLGTEPDYLMTVMAIETSRPLTGGGVEETFDPQIKASTSNAVGLIQFLPATATALGTTATALQQMSAVEQLDYVKKYLLPYKGKMTTVEDTYLAVFYPAMIGKADTELLPANFYKPNISLDKDGDGKITRGEITLFVRRKLEKGRSLKG